MARMTIEPNEDGVRIAPLGALDDFQVAQGYPDVRGWKVFSSDGQEVGKVHELLIDVDNLRTRYLDVRLTQAIAATPGDRDVLVPIGTFNEGGDVVLWAGVSPVDFPTLTVTREEADGDQASSGSKILVGTVNAGR